MLQFERNARVRRMLFNICRLFYLSHHGGFEESSYCSARVLLSRRPHHVYMDPDAWEMHVENEEGQPDSGGHFPPSREYLLNLMDELEEDLRLLRQTLEKEGLKSTKSPAMMQRYESNLLRASEQILDNYIFPWTLSPAPQEINEWFV